MGILIDSSVLVAYERRGQALDALRDQEAAISAITASEMLHGVHRARTEAQRRSRAEFVEVLLAALPIVPIDLLATLNRVAFERVEGLSLVTL